MKKKMLKRIQEIFYAKLEEKTNWGRNKVKAAYQTSVSEAILEFADEIKAHNETGA